MNENWKDKLRERMQTLKKDPKAAKSLLLLKICIADVIAYSIIVALHIPGIVGLVLRFICIAILFLVLIKAYK